MGAKMAGRVCLRLSSSSSPAGGQTNYSSPIVCTASEPCVGIGKSAPKSFSTARHHEAVPK